MSRRDLMRGIGLGAAIALPVITSLGMPSSAEAGSCLSDGASCSSNGQCCSGFCSVTCYPT